MGCDSQFDDLYDKKHKVRKSVNTNQDARIRELEEEVARLKRIRELEAELYKLRG